MLLESAMRQLLLIKKTWLLMKVTLVNHGFKDLWKASILILSVEERLSAVVALIGIANEGNSIRIILEECLEAANALKKQMWAEVQLDKCRMKEEYVMKIQYPSYISDKTEPNVQISSVEGRQSPLPTVDDKNNLVSTNPVEHKEHLHDTQNDPNYSFHMPSKRNPQIQEVSTCADNLSLLQPGYAAERSWSQLKSYIGHKAEEIYVYRSLPLGQDRRRNRYWQFITSSSRNDPGSGRIFVELRHGCWRLIDSEEDYEAMPILLLFLLFLLGRIIPDKLQSRSREDYNIVESMEPDPPAGFCEQMAIRTDLMDAHLYAFKRNGDDDSVAKMKAAEDALQEKEKQKPSFELSGKLASETNRVRGVTLLFNEPSDARKPDIRWRLYVFKKSDLLILKTIKQSVEPRNSVCHSATIYANAIMHAGTTVDTFLRENLESASATRRCSACEALGRAALVMDAQMFVFLAQCLIIPANLCILQDRRSQDNVSIIIVDLGGQIGKVCLVQKENFVYELGQAFATIGIVIRSMDVFSAFCMSFQA
ncbi:unnamed protein product [Camellia sinensis]